MGDRVDADDGEAGRLGVAARQANEPSAVLAVVAAMAK